MRSSYIELKLTDKNEFRAEAAFEINGISFLHKATGGAGQTGEVFVSDGTIMSDNVGKCKCNGVAYTSCDVQGDNGERYGCIWNDPNPPKTGTMVRIVHCEPAGTEWYSGLYEAKRI